MISKLKAIKEALELNAKSDWSENFPEEEFSSLANQLGSVIESLAKPTFFLFGGEPVRTYQEEGLEGLLKEINENNHFEGRLIVYNAEEHPSGLLSAYEGNEGFQVLSEEVFDKLNKAVDELNRRI